MFKVGDMVYDRCTHRLLRIHEIRHNYSYVLKDKNDGLYVMTRSKADIFKPSELEKLIYGF